MKTLKFMLAAATAIGLASAYAEPDAGASTGFEGIELETPVVTGLKDDGTSGSPSFFYYDGDTAEENESTIVSITGTGNLPASLPRGATGDSQKILQVSTGEKPLLRTFQSLSGGKPQDATGFTQDVYVDTLVQFTVTPYTDKVTPGESDKLMIYLKEYTNSVGTVEGTNLVVVGGYCPQLATFVAKDYKAQLQTPVEPGKWYRLTVRAVPNVGNSVTTPAFMVYLDGQVLTFDSTCCADMMTQITTISQDYQSVASASQMVFSILGTSAGATLQAVGFAGEGKVDDLMITSGLDPFATVYNFTFNWDPNEVTAISYTIGGESKDQAVSNIQVEDGTQVVINSITFGSSYELDTITLVGLRDDGNNTYTVTNNATLTIVAQEKQNTPLEPGQQDPTTYNSQAAAEAAAAKVTVGVPAAVAAELTTAQQEAYAALFEAKVVSDGAGGYKVEVGLTADAEDDLQDQVDDDAAEVIADLSESTVTLTTTPGLYYSFEYGTTLENMTEGARTLATGDELEVTRPTSLGANAGFYKVLVNVTDK